MLQFFNFIKPIRIKIDTLDLIIKTYLLQLKSNSKWHPITYYSKKISSLKQNYNIINKELLAIIATLKK